MGKPELGWQCCSPASPVRRPRLFFIPWLLPSRSGSHVFPCSASSELEERDLTRKGRSLSSSNCTRQIDREDS